MPRGAAGGAAAFGLTACLAAANGGFDATTWNLALIVVCAVTLVVLVVDGGERPPMHATVFAGALALLTAWTALSSDSPPLALYFAVALAVVQLRRRLEPRWLCARVAGAVRDTTDMLEPAAVTVPV